MTSTGPRILAFDCETSPNVAHVWGLWQQNVSLNQLFESTRMICFGARWLGSKQVVFKSEFHHGRQAMVEKLHSLLDEADAVMGWNSKGFDVKHCNREFLEAGMTPPSPFKNLDLMLEVKKQFRLPSNKLQYVSTLLGLEGKVSHEGHSLWVSCLAGDRKAWARMKTYQIRDVDLLIEMYEKLQPWIGSSHPHHGLYSGIECCQKCGGTDLEKRGFAYTAIAAFQQYRCNGCGGWTRSGKRIQGVDLRGL